MILPFSYVCNSRCDLWPLPVGSDYDAYLKDLEELCHGMAREGCRVVKIDVKPADLLAWCQARGVEVNSKSRAEYAADRIREMHQMR